jgi:hypothetical protein
MQQPNRPTVRQRAKEEFMKTEETDTEPMALLAICRDCLKPGGIALRDTPENRSSFPDMVIYTMTKAQALSRWDENVCTCNEENDLEANRATIVKLEAEIAKWKTWGEYACKRFTEETGKDLQAQSA